MLVWRMLTKKMFLAITRCWCAHSLFVLLCAFEVQAAPPLAGEGVVGVVEEGPRKALTSRLAAEFHAAFPEVRRAQALEETLSSTERRWRAHKERLAVCCAMEMLPTVQLSAWSVFFGHAPGGPCRSSAHPPLFAQLLTDHLTCDVVVSVGLVTDWIDTLYETWLEVLYHLFTMPRAWPDVGLLGGFLKRMSYIGAEELWQQLSVKIIYGDRDALRNRLWCAQKKMLKCLRSLP